MNEYRINDLFSVRQGKQLFDKNKQSTDGQNDKDAFDSNVFKLLTMNSINYDNKTIEQDSFLDYVTTNTIDKETFLTADNYIINRIGKIKSASLLEFVDFDFTKTNVLASNHFIVLTPRKIVKENLPLFHALVDVGIKNFMERKVLNELIIKAEDVLHKLMDKKAEDAQNELIKKAEDTLKELKKKKATYDDDDDDDAHKNSRKKVISKVQSISVKEIQNIKIFIPPNGFDELTKMFMEIYQPFLKSLKNLKFHKNLLEEFKNELNKKQ